MSRLDKYLLFTLVILLSFGAIPAVSAAPPMISSGFESGGSQVPAPWRYLFNNAVWGSEIRLTQDIAYAGNWSLLINDDRSDRGIGLRSELLPIRPSATYKGQAYLYNKGSASGSIYLEFWDAKQTRIHNIFIGTTARNTWAPIVIQDQAPVGAEYVSLLLYSSGPSVGTVYFDAVTLEEVQPATAAAASLKYRVEQKTIQANTITAMGNPISIVRAGASALGWLANGERVWYVSAPGMDGTDHLYRFRLGETTPSAQYSYPGGGGQMWSMVAQPNGDVYLTVGASLFRYDAAQDRVIALGRPHADTGMIWELAIAPDGMIYGATYPKGRIFQVDTVTNRLVDLGSVTSAEYARSIAVSERYVFVGTGPELDIVAYDRKTGATQSLLPAEYKTETGFIDDVDVRGNRLFAATGGGFKPTLIFDTDTLEQVGSVFGLTPPISPANQNKQVFFRLNGITPYLYDLTSDKYRQHGFAMPAASTLDWAQLPPEIVPEARRSFFSSTTLLGCSGTAYWAFDTQSKQVLNIPMEIPASPVRINSFGAKDGKVYGGGITPGGLFIYDTATGSYTKTAALGQTDGLTLFNNKLYFGTYPGANLKVYDPQLDAATALSSVGFDQDRPVAMLEHQGSIYVGTVPGYGLQGGALAVLNPDTGVTRTYNNVIPNHSVVALAAHADVVYGSTSTLGGLGHERAPGDAYLFAWDPAANKVTWQMQPLPGEPAIGALTCGADGLLWGGGTHSIFALDPQTQEVVFKQQVINSSIGAYTWRESFAAQYKQYVVITMVSRNLAIIDTEQQRVQLVSGPFNRIAIDDAGVLYYTSGTELFSISPEIWTQL